MAKKVGSQIIIHLFILQMLILNLKTKSIQILNLNPEIHCSCFLEDYSRLKNYKDYNIYIDQYSSCINGSPSFLKIDLAFHMIYDVTNIQ